MASLWIVHREARLQAALARLAAAPTDALRAAPGDARFDAEPVPDVVVLGVSGDFEAELEFAYRQGPRLRDAGWVLVASSEERAEVERLFDTLDAEILDFPPDALLLRERIRAAVRRSSTPLPLSRRPRRAELRERFTRWFADLDAPELLRLVDPRLAEVPLLILGEAGTGRSLLARYAHGFGGTPGGGLIAVPCTPATSGARLLEALDAARPGSPAGCSVLLEDVDTLEPGLQRELRSWVEFGAPEGAAWSDRVRWIGTARDDAALDPGLRRALAGLRVRIPPLRERRRAIAPFANDTARHWCALRGLAPRRMGEDAVQVLEEYPWPGNLRELEAVVEQTLAAGSGDPIGAGDLVLEGRAFAPLEAGAVGTLLPDEPEPAVSEAPVAAEVPSEVAPEAAPPPEAMPAQTEAEATPEAGADASLRRLAGALAHEVRNPLTAIRSFAALLPDRYGDSDFRGRFAELVGDGVERIEDVVERLERLATLAPPARSAVDMENLLSELLRERRDTIRRRRLLVLKELDRDRPHAEVDPDQIRFAFEALLNQALELVPERGDLYCASRHHAAGLGGGPTLRILVRFRGPDTGGGGPAVEGLAPAENALEFVIAEAVVRAQGGTMAVDAGEAETVVVVDLPAPG